jgi:hypothetical protein
MSAWGKLHAATLELTKGTSLKQRLAAAFSKHLCYLDAAELPFELRAEFTQLARGLESVKPLPGETAAQATVRKMSADEADLFATRIVQLFGEVARLQPAGANTPLNGAHHDHFDERAAHERYEERKDKLSVVPLLYAADA